MTQIQLNLKSFPYGKQLATIFERYSDDYEYTSEGVFRRVTPPLCPECGNPMDHNGSNTHTKRWLGEVEIGRYLCPKCKTNIEENCDFWEEAKDEFFGILTNFSQFLRANQVSLEVIEKALQHTLFDEDIPPMRHALVVIGRAAQTAVERAVVHDADLGVE